MRRAQDRNPWLRIDGTSDHRQNIRGDLVELYRKARLVALLLTAPFFYCPAAAGPAPRPDSQPDRVNIAYVAPKSDEHREILRLLKERQVLESFRDYFSPLRLPQHLLIKLDECGTDNAWYDPNLREVTVCYEYIAAVVRSAPSETTPEGITREDAIVGPTTEVFLHEVAHALFDMLKIPVLGREEDAADRLAAFALLQLGSEEARRAVIGTAYMLSREAETEPSKEQFAKGHGLAAQRFYNLLCMAYGAHPALFADVAQAALPRSRADVCGEEYEQVRHAFRELIVPHLEPTRLGAVQARKFLKFEMRAPSARERAK
jgi:hypothetical protein